MPDVIRFILTVLSLVFVVVGGYYRIQSQLSGESLDRTREGWPILVGIRLVGLISIGCTAFWFENPARFAWAALSTPVAVRWLGVAGFALAVAWLLWMFQALGRNLTDTVVTRKEAFFVDHGPYRFVRNPMYTGVLIVGVALGLALGTWLIPLLTTVMFALFAVRTRIEEKYLVERFGDRYRVYMRRVGRFFPKVFA